MTYIEELTHLWIQMIVIGMLISALVFAGEWVILIGIRWFKL